MSHFKPLRFSRDRNDFYTVLNQRVNEYFKTQNISRHADWRMVLKTVFMIALYWIPYFLIIGGVFSSNAGNLIMCVVMGLGLAGIGLSVMHDACHGSYSNNPLVNKWLGYTLNMMGATAFNWKVQHNVLHHTYTNVHDHDEDVSQRGIFRLNPNADWKSFHRFQFLYAWFFYGLMTFAWVFIKDISRLKKYQKNGLVQRVNGSAREEWIILIVTKVLYFTYAFVIPCILLPYSFWGIFLGFFIVHYVAGFILAIVFQPAHVTSDSIFPMPNEELTLENNFFIHQILTTKNFANNSTWFSWYVGGLNFQIEHHLFPNICHIHYKSIAPIVKETIHEFDLPYYEEKTFAKAIFEHGMSLHRFGQKPDILPKTSIAE